LKALVLGGAGAMGMVAVRDLVESRVFSEVVIGDVNLEKAREVAEWAGKDCIKIQKVDVSNSGDLISAMKEVDVVAKFGSEKMEIVKEVHIFYGDISLEPAKYKWAFRTVLEEYTRGPVVYRKGKFKRLPPFSGKQRVKFPEPVGERNCCYGLYSGVATLPFTVGKGIKKVDCAMSYTKEDEQRIKVLTEMGLTSTERIKLNGAAISPREFLLRLAPPPDVKVRDAASVMVEVIGKSQGEETKCLYSLVQGYHETYRVSATAYLTGVPLSIATQMLAKDKISLKGVLPPETAVSASYLFEELAQRGIRIRETIQRTRVL